MLDILIRVRERIADPTRFCQHSMARDANNRPALPTDDNATAWDLFGAVMIESQDTGLFNQVIEHIDRHSPVMLSTLNDQRGHEAVLEVLDQAIADLSNLRPD